jgi:cob(I)alamin adenosyltransferase
MKIYTKTGDSGETSLLGGKRVWKDNLRIQTCGTIDELNSIIGLSINEITNSELKEVLQGIQNDLFVIGSDAAMPIGNVNSKISILRIAENLSEKLESIIDKYDSQLPVLKNFILPGGAKGSALLHFARSVCRRAERNVVALSQVEKINPSIEKYMNRLSDLLFVLARYVNFSNGTSDIIWQK